MGGGAIVPALEESAGKAFVQGVKELETHSGDALLRSLGTWGVKLADLTKSFEQFRDGNKSFARESMRKIFSEVPEQYHTELENHALGKPNTLPQQYAPQGQRLATLKDTIERKADQSGQRVVVNKRRVPFMLHKDGPFIHDEDVMTPNHPTRRAAIQEVMQRHNINSTQASKLLDNTVLAERGRNGVSHISMPQDTIHTGRLPVQHRWSKWAESAAGRISENIYFGNKDQNLQGIVAAIYHDKGQVSANTAADFLDVLTRESHSGAWRRGTGAKLQSAYRPTTDTERLVRKFSGYLLTSRLAIPHATQIINSMLNEGFINTLSGIRERVLNYGAWRDLVVHSGALEEELHRNNELALKGGESLFQKLFHQPGFHWERARFIEVAALASQREVEMAASKLLGGGAWDNLMTGGRSGAEATLKRLGIDPAEVQRVGGLTPEMRKTAMYNSAKQAMFFRSPTLTPPLRDAGPFRRISYMYSHYHFNMFRIIKNGLRDSYREGGIAGASAYATKLATLLPAAGYLLQVVENGLYRRDLTHRDISPTGIDPVDNYLNALAHASAFGIIYSINRANKGNMLSNLVTGPIPSMMISTGEDILKAVTGSPTYTGEKKHDVRPVERDVLRRIPIVGPTVSGTVLPYDEKHPATRRPIRHTKPSGAGWKFD